MYKRIAEYCLDIEDICADNLVHELTLTVPVNDQKPLPGPLFHPLRHCNISGLSIEHFSDSFMNGEKDQYAGAMYMESP